MPFRQAATLGIQHHTDMRSLCLYGAKGPPTSGPSCQSKPNHRRASTIAAVNSDLHRARSRSLFLKISLPLCARARSCPVQKVRACPKCKYPVGDRASRPRYGASLDIGTPRGCCTTSKAPGCLLLEPFRKTRKRRTKQPSSFIAVQRCVRGARRSPVLSEGSGLYARI